ncbi:hypothetical protein [Candidatus Enterococcus mangumiae]|uniref:WxL domain-containing protein n=1 Tax=Candidatus Enterococcus mangumiae TaxID=2230878 RepID=A0ABZ2SZV3_9ENTE|nr:hypothetical protein [Enterococcus sp. DIV1094]MBO0489899.1 hypothetical protein [Enterococcus sp. DIV1094]
MEKLSRLLIFISIICLTSSTMSQHYALTTRIENSGPITVNSSDSAIAETSENTSTESTTHSIEEPEKMARAEQQSLSDKINQTSVLESGLNVESEQSITAYVGTGTESDPFLVGSQAEMTSALSIIRNDSGTGPYYIELTGNIVYTGLNIVFSFYKNLIIDGKGYYLLHSNDSSSEAGTLFNAATAGLTITLRNINFGSDTLMDNNGIIYDRNPARSIYSEYQSSSYYDRLEVVIENVHYYGTVYSRVINSAKVTFKGDNSFRNAGRFTIHKQILVAENSTTLIDDSASTETNTSRAAFLSLNNLDEDVLILERNAELSIITHAPSAIYVDNLATVDIKDEARLFVHTLHPTAYSSHIVQSSASPHANMTIRVGQDATVVHESQSVIGNVYHFWVNKPKYILFRSKTRETTRFRGYFRIFRQDRASDFGGDYQVNYLYGGNRLLTTPVFFGNTALVDMYYVDNGTLGSYDIIYQPSFIINDIQVEPEVDLDISNLNITINAVSPVERPLINYNFKLSRQRLWTGSSLRTLDAQRIVESATLSTSGVVAVQSSATEGVWKEQKLQAGTYYVYLQATGLMQEDPSLAHLPSSSLWYEVVIEVPRSPLNIEVPLEKIFKVREEGEFDTIELSKPIISHSNFPINLTVTEVVEHTTDSPVTLVNEILPDSDKHLRLHLASTDNQDSGPLVVGENQASPIEIPPFFDNPLHLYLKGHYVGGLHVKHDVSYSFIYQLTAK